MLTFVGSLLGTNLVKAVEMASRQRKVANDFSTTFPRSTMQKWRQMVEEWQANPSRPNPYVSNERGTSLWGCSSVDPYCCFASVKGFQGPTAAHSRRAYWGRRWPTCATQDFCVRFHSDGSRAGRSTVSFHHPIPFPSSDTLLGTTYALRLLEKRGPTVRRQPSSRNGVFSCTRLRNGVKYKQSTCLERSTPIPPTWNPHRE
jgi:hypothetical protein